MNAFFGGSWAGMAMITDLDRHVIDRFLAAPTSRFAIILSQVVRAGITAMLQASANKDHEMLRHVLDTMSVLVNTKDGRSVLTS